MHNSLSQSSFRENRYLNSVLVALGRFASSWKILSFRKTFWFCISSFSLIPPPPNRVLTVAALHGFLGFEEFRNLELTKKMRATLRDRSPTPSAVLGVFRPHLEVPRLQRCGGHVQFSSPATIPLSSYRGTDLLGWFMWGLFAAVHPPWFSAP